MPGTKLEPARHLLANVTVDELATIARRSRLARPWPRGRARLTEALTRHLTLDDLVERVIHLYPRARRTGDFLDRLPPRHGPVAVRAGRNRGALLLGPDDAPIHLELSNVPLFLENRFPVLARVAAARSRAGRTDLVDDGEYQLRAGRLRLELTHSGPLSFLVVFLRRRAGRAEYLLEPIA